MSKMSVSKMSGKHLTAIVAIGAALSFGMGAAFAADDVTEDQILKALAPAKKRNGSISEGDLDIANAKDMDPNIAKEFADYGVQ